MTESDMAILIERMKDEFVTTDDLKQFGEALFRNMDKRFDAMEKRFETTDKKYNAMLTKMDQLLGSIHDWRTEHGQFQVEQTAQNDAIQQLADEGKIQLNVELKTSEPVQ